MTTPEGIDPCEVFSKIPESVQRDLEDGDLKTKSELGISQSDVSTLCACLYLTKHQGGLYGV